METGVLAMEGTSPKHFFLASSSESWSVMDVLQELMTTAFSVPPGILNSLVNQTRAEITAQRAIWSFSTIESFTVLMGITETTQAYNVKLAMPIAELALKVEKVFALLENLTLLLFTR